ncbi:Spo11/DNA topoisomerase VI subunit A [Multifurca ochricompacta]|uniref:DNA topoisomerase (ATP-hydrolyzing) n=1 Tax=Multifurca ochricompacta TaxID=376703 RepID=A0AAD4M7Z7_9AGAM|nr:Spo11/DNA topoisomerase VI subunit A [Multifurca ochricompacta]
MKPNLVVVIGTRVRILTPAICDRDHQLVPRPDPDMHPLLTEAPVNDDCDCFPDLLADEDGFNSPFEDLGIYLNSPPTPTQNISEYERDNLAPYNRSDDLTPLNMDDSDSDDCPQPHDKCRSAIGAQSRTGEALTKDAMRCAPAVGEFIKTTRYSSVQRIEAMALDFLEQLSAALPSTKEEIEEFLSKRPKVSKKLELKLTDRRKRFDSGASGTRTQIFPRGTRASIIPFAQFFRIADLAHEAIVDGLPTTKRDLFYKDVQLFKKQVTVDKLVDDLAATINTERAHLNIVNKPRSRQAVKPAEIIFHLKRASPKGLICGIGLLIHTSVGDVIHVTESEGTLIPLAEDISTLSLPNDVNWVLIVEKEAVFQTLRQLGFVRHPFSQPGTGIMITGKGYPDLATRQFAKKLSDSLPPTVPIVALVDGDAYGIDIASVYKFGSVTLRHESHNLAAPRIECIGIWTSELALQARSMLRRELPERWKRELTYMLYMRHKAETEILCSVPRSLDEPHPLVRYLTDKISERIRALALEPTPSVLANYGVDEALLNEF